MHVDTVESAGGEIQSMFKLMGLICSVLISISSAISYTGSYIAI